MEHSLSIGDKCLSRERLDWECLELADPMQVPLDRRSAPHHASVELLDSENDISPPTAPSVPLSPKPFARARRWQESTLSAFS